MAPGQTLHDPVNPPLHHLWPTMTGPHRPLERQVPLGRQL